MGKEEAINDGILNIVESCVTLINDKGYVTWGKSQAIRNLMHITDVHPNTNIGYLLVTGLKE